MLTRIFVKFMLQTMIGSLFKEDYEYSKYMKGKRAQNEGLGNKLLLRKLPAADEKDVQRCALSKQTQWG